jgi:uncharacterized protein (DUF983 family)
MFSGMLAFKDQCPECKLILADRDVGDGAVFLVITFIGFLVTVSAVTVELVYEPPLWVHAFLWFPATMVLAILGLRVTRAFMLLMLHKEEVKQQEVPRDHHA